MSEPAAGLVARRIVMTGRVQGVGFRPFVYRLAHEYGLGGHVKNLRGDVEVVVCGPASSVSGFERDIVARAPPLALPSIRSSEGCALPAAGGFHIAASSASDAPQVSVPPDFYA